MLEQNLNDFYSQMDTKLYRHVSLVNGIFHAHNTISMCITVDMYYSCICVHVGFVCSKLHNVSLSSQCTLYLINSTSTYLFIKHICLKSSIN